MTADRAPLQIIRAIPATSTEPGMVQFRTNGVRDAVHTEPDLRGALMARARTGSAWADGSNSVDESDLNALLRAIREAK